MGYTYDKDGKKTDNGISGTLNKSWPGDLWKTGGASTWLGGTYEPKTGLAYFGTGNPAPWNSHLRKGDNLYSCSTVAIDLKTGQIKWSYQNTPHDGWDFDGVNEFVLFDMDGRQASGGKADRNGFFFVIDADQRAARQRLPVRQQDHLGHGLRPQDRPAELHRREPPGRPDPGQRPQEGHHRVRRARLPRRQELDADGLQPRDGAVLRARPTSGAWTSGTSPSPTRRARPISAPASPSSRSTTTTSASLRAMDPKTGKIVWEIQEQGAAVGRRADHRAATSSSPARPRAILKAVRRQDRQGAVEVQDRLGRGRARRSPGDRTASNMSRVMSGWGGAVPLWGGEVAKKVAAYQPGRHALGVQDPGRQDRAGGRPGQGRARRLRPVRSSVRQDTRAAAGGGTARLLPPAPRRPQEHP